MRTTNIILLILFLAIITLISSACSPIKRLERLHKNHPYLFTNAKDTITIHDTVEVITPHLRVDTVFSEVKEIDELNIKKDKLSVKIVKKHDALHVDAECKSDTIYVPHTVEVVVDKYVLPELKYNWYRLLWIPVVLLVLFILYRLLKKYLL